MTQSVRFDGEESHLLVTPYPRYIEMKWGEGDAQELWGPLYERAHTYFGPALYVAYGRVGQKRYLAKHGYVYMGQLNPYDKHSHVFVRDARDLGCP